MAVFMCALRPLCSGGTVSAQLSREAGLSIPLDLGITQLPFAGAAPAELGTMLTACAFFLKLKVGGDPGGDKPLTSPELHQDAVARRGRGAAGAPSRVPRGPAGRGGACGRPLLRGGDAGLGGRCPRVSIPPSLPESAGGMWAAAPLLLLLLLLLVPLLLPLGRRGAARLEPAGRAVLITGCDSGFGHLLALRLHRLGFTVFAGCLWPGGAGARRLQREAGGGGRLRVLRLDVTRAGDVRAAKEMVLSHLPERGEPGAGGAAGSAGQQPCRQDPCSLRPGMLARSCLRVSCAGRVRIAGTGTDGANCGSRGW